MVDEKYIALMAEKDWTMMKLIQQIEEHDPSKQECFFLGYSSAVNDMRNEERRRVIEQFIAANPKGDQK